MESQPTVLFHDLDAGERRAPAEAASQAAGAATAATPSTEEQGTSSRAESATAAGKNV